MQSVCHVVVVVSVIVVANNCYPYIFTHVYIYSFFLFICMNNIIMQLQVKMKSYEDEAKQNKSNKKYI